MHCSAPAYFTLNFAERRMNGNEKIIVVYLSEPPTVIRPNGKEEKENGKRSDQKSEKRGL